MANLRAFEDIAAGRWENSEPADLPESAVTHRWHIPRDPMGALTYSSRSGSDDWTSSWFEEVGADPLDIHYVHLGRIEYPSQPLIWSPMGQINAGRLPQIISLKQLSDGWDGEGTLGPSEATVTTAATFTSLLVNECGAISPTRDGEILFEWDLPNGVSIFAHATDNEVAVTMFDSQQTFVDVVLSVRNAAHQTNILLNDPVLMRTLGPRTDG